MAIERNITLSDNYFTGEDKNLLFTFFQRDRVTRQDITGWTINWMVKRRATDDDAAAKISKTAVITGGPTGDASVTLTNEDIAVLSAGTYLHAAKRMDDGSGTVLTHGSITWRQGVQRA